MILCGVTNMLRALFLRISLICFSLITSLSYASITHTPTPPDIDAAAYILVDFHSGKILADKEANKRIDPASLTKMMTIYIIDHELKNGRFKMEDEVPISENAWRTEGSRMFVPVNKKVPVKDLLYGSIIQSGNDATVALAEFVAGNEGAFADLMNQYAKMLGMNNTHFMNSTGIPNADHYTTARDLAVLARALIRDFPDTYKIYSEKWFTYNGIKQPNRNRLLWREPFVDGIKTGHSSSAGFCLAASGKKDKMRLISIVVGSNSENERTEQTLQLLRFGFRFFETHHLFQANTSLNEPRIWMAEQKTLPLGITDDLYITIPQGQYKNLDAKMNINKQITAPIIKGNSYGKLVVKLNDRIITEKPLVALQNVSSGTIWNRLSDYVSLGFYKILNNNNTQDSPQSI